MRAGPEVAPENLVLLYEDLRRRVLGEGAGPAGGLGAALFVHKGVLAWMRAWSDCTRPREGAAIQEPPAHDSVPPRLQPEVVMILAGMALNHYQEVA